MGFECLDEDIFGYLLPNSKLTRTLRRGQSGAGSKLYSFAARLLVLLHYLFASSMYFRRKLTTSGEVCDARWNSRSPASPTSKRGWKRIVAIAS
jgi:hypothetical protein